MRSKPTDNAARAQGTPPGARAAVPHPVKAAKRSEQRPARPAARAARGAAPALSYGDAIDLGVVLNVLRRERAEMRGERADLDRRERSLDRAIELALVLETKIKLGFPPTGVLADFVAQDELARQARQLPPCEPMEPSELEATVRRQGLGCLRVLRAQGALPPAPKRKPGASA